jgi:predicted site-specific integrase-resolvase
MQNLKPLKTFAEQCSISYRTAHRHWKNGILDGVQLENGTIMVKGYKSNKNNILSHSVIFLRHSINQPYDERLKSLESFASQYGFKDAKIIIWEAYKFQENPHLEELYNSGFTDIFVYDINDLFNDKAFLMNLFSEKGILVHAVKKDEESNATMMYKCLTAAAKMARAAVGMSSYKKEISEAHSSILD